MNKNVEREKEQIAKFFIEDVELVIYDLRSVCHIFRVKSINGKLISHRVIISFYNDRAFLPLESRKGYAGKLKVVDTSVFGCADYATVSLRFRTEDCENRTYLDLPVVGSKMSLVDLLCEAYIQSCKIEKEFAQEMVATVLDYNRQFENIREYLRAYEGGDRIWI